MCVYILYTQTHTHVHLHIVYTHEFQFRSLTRKSYVFFSYNENTRLKGSGTLRDFSRRGRRRRRRKNDVAEKKPVDGGLWNASEQECKVFSTDSKSMISQLCAINAYDDLLFWIHSRHISLLALLAFVQVLYFCHEQIFDIARFWLLGSSDWCLYFRRLAASRCFTLAQIMLTMHCIHRNCLFF